MAYSKENPCSQNAEEIYVFFRRKGWSRKAVYALLGNIQYESDGILATRGEYGTGGGYGLVQWTPKSKLTIWADKNDLDYTEISTQCKRIEYECENAIQWNSSKQPSTFHYMTFKKFSTSDESVSYLTKAFLICYEQPADPSKSQDKRIEYANHWSKYFSSWAS